MTIRRKASFSFVAGLVCAAMYSGPGYAGGTEHTKNKSEAKQRLTDPEILGVTEAANNGEVAQGKLAEQKATKQAAKSFANMMVADHDAANKKIEALSKELGMDPKDSAVSAEVKSSGDAVQRKLNQSATGAFDHVYLQSQINEHEKVLKTFDEQLIPAASSPKLKSLLGDLRAHVAHHLAVAKSALATIDKAG